MLNSTKNIDEKQLIIESIAGNKQSFGCLYDKYYGQIYRYLYYRTASEEQALDLSSEVFLRAWSHLTDFGQQKKFQLRPWLYRIAHNLLVDHYRKEKSELILKEYKNENIKDDDPLEQVEQRQKSIGLAMVLKKLDQITQAVIACRFINGMSHKDTAQALGISEGNVRIIQFRGLKKIKKMLSEVGYE